MDKNQGFVTVFVFVENLFLSLPERSGKKGRFESKALLRLEAVKTNNIYKTMYCIFQITYF